MSILSLSCAFFSLFFFFFNDTATTEIYTPSLHDALPILLISHITVYNFHVRGPSNIMCAKIAFLARIESILAPFILFSATGRNLILAIYHFVELVMGNCKSDFISILAMQERNK